MSTLSWHPIVTSQCYVFCVVGLQPRDRESEAASCEPGCIEVRIGTVRTMSHAIEYEYEYALTPKR
eukprot:scaffold178341_cov20-Prasinocladus_malaysianus.AAC.1